MQCIKNGILCAELHVLVLKLDCSKEKPSEFIMFFIAYLAFRYTNFENTSDLGSVILLSHVKYLSEKL